MSLALLLACTSHPERPAAPRPSVGAPVEGGVVPVSAPAGPPNVLVVLLDDVGTDKVAVYGEHPHPAHTPNLDALAGEGVLFRNAWAMSSCSPTRAALLTGRYPRRTGVGRTVQAYMENYELRPAELTVPELLHRAPDAWATSEVGKWHLATYSSPDNLAGPGVQGFDWYAAVVSNLNEGVVPGDKETYYDWEKDDNGVLIEESDYVTSDQVDDAVARIRTMPEPWFLYLAFNAPHMPLAVPPPDLAGPNEDVGTSDEDLVRMYHQTLEAADTEIGRLLAEVDLDRTVVFVLGDNGTPDHAVLAPLDPEQSKLSMYEGGLNVPFLVAGPGVARGAESAALVSVVDLFPTVAELAGVDVRGLSDKNGDRLPIDGHSLVDVLADPSLPGEPYVYSEEFSPLGFGPYHTDQRAIRDDRWKYVVADTTGEEHLMDLEGRNDDGPDLLDARLTPEAQAALDRLRGAMADYVSHLVPF